VAHEQQVVPHTGDGAGSKDPELPVQDLDTSQGKNDFRRAMRGVKPTDVFAEIGASPDGRARASIVRRNPRRVIAEAVGASRADGLAICSRPRWHGTCEGNGP
jgi:hypothetical protein